MHPRRPLASCSPGANDLTVGERRGQRSLRVCSRTRANRLLVGVEKLPMDEQGGRIEDVDHRGQADGQVCRRPPRIPVPNRARQSVPGGSPRRCRLGGRAGERPGVRERCHWRRSRGSRGCRTHKDASGGDGDVADLTGEPAMSPHQPASAHHAQSDARADVEDGEVIKTSRLAELTFGHAQRMLVLNHEAFEPESLTKVAARGTPVDDVQFGDRTSRFRRWSISPGTVTPTASVRTSDVPSSSARA